MRQPLVLIVDDTEDNRVLYSAAFSYAGFRVKTASHGREALDEVASEMPDAILMDLAMPVMDGWQTTRTLKQDERTRVIPVIVVTGQVTEDSLNRAREAGADHVCTKPCMPRRLVELVTDRLSRVASRS